MGRGYVIWPTLGFLLLSALLNGQVMPIDTLLGQGQLPLMRRLAITPKQQEFDPVTGEPVGQKAKPKIDPDTGLPMAPVAEEPPQLQFDPATGELAPAEPTRTASFPGEPSGRTATLESMIATAEAEALRSHDKAKHNTIGAAGCLFGGLGLLVTTAYVESGASRFDENSASLSATYYRSLPVELQSAYKKAYREKEKSLRRKSVYGTQGICLLAFIGLIFLGGGIL